MKRNTFLTAFIVLTTGTVWAEDLPKDSLRVIDVEEVVVIASPKENRKLRELPTASTLLSQKEMQANQVTSLKSLTSLVPNLFIPDYGSKLTSAIYIRGIGSRINTPSVGLYVDNVPYIDKSAFDFNYSDIERIDVLRGPQGTLYGRNTMGGLIKVHTKSPFTYQGTDLRLSAGTYNNYNASVTHYHRSSDRFAFSTGGFYEYAGGFFENSAKDNRKVDRTSAGGGRFRGIYLPNDNLKMDLTLSYERSVQGGYPYFYMGRVNADQQATDLRSSHIGKISYNDDSDYNRGLFNAGLNIEYQAQHFTLSAVTGYQNLNDRMRLDQDFTEKDIFTLNQKQKLNTLSEEIMMKSKPGQNWQWATGIFGFYQWLNTDGPVEFKEGGVKEVIEGNVNNIFPQAAPAAPGAPPSRIPSMKMTVHTPTLNVTGNFDTPTFSTAIYHQSTYNNLFVEGLSVTAGLRLDYEKTTIKYRSNVNPVDFGFRFAMGPMVLEDEHMIASPAGFDGKLSNDYLQLLPKFAIQYEWKKGNNVYATASRGYRSGGYNVQMFSEVIQSQLKNSMKSALMGSPTFKSMATMIDKMMKDEEINVAGSTTFKPEYAWNYEVGSHLTLWDDRLWVDLSAFYMDTNNQQVAQFSETGLGRITKNAGKSSSYGAEAAFRASLTNELSLTAAYGYTYATFKDYETIDTDTKKLTNYKGNYIPFVPKHTLNLGAQYIFQMAARCWLDRVQLNANYSAAGRIYWTEKNNASQAFYGTLNGRVSLEKGNGAIAFWVRNATNKEYQSFYFESMGNQFMQKGRPMQLGIDVRCRF